MHFIKTFPFFLLNFQNLNSFSFLGVEFKMLTSLVVLDSVTYITQATRWTPIWRTRRYAFSCHLLLVMWSCNTKFVLCSFTEHVLSWPSCNQSPSLSIQDDDSEDLDDMTIKPEDAVIVCARNEDDVSHLEACNT